MTRLRTAIFALLFTGLAATTASADLDVERTLTVTGIDRSYCLYRPDSYREGAPVVFYFHGGLGDCHLEDADAWRDKADAEGFLLVAPNGLNKDWNACSAPPERCHAPSTLDEYLNVDDLAFFDAVSDLVDAEYLPGAHYAAGMSKGGMFVYHLLCHRAGAIDAAAVMAGTELSQTCAGESVPLLHLHGLDDRYVPWLGGGLMGMEFSPVPPAIEAQAERNGCAGETVSQRETRDATSYRYRGCDSETVYWRYRCQHGLPGITTGWWWWMFGLGCTGSFHAEDPIWAFFARQ